MDMVSQHDTVGEGRERHGARGRLVSRRSVASLAVLVVALAASGAAAPVLAQETQSVQVAIASTDVGGPSGVAVLTPAAAGGTSVQVLAQDAATGTTVVLHTGTCEAPGTDLVGLVGTLGDTGQALGTVPYPLGTLTDGAHLVSLHPGMDFATTLGCGEIPKSAVGPVPPDVVECAGVADWVIDANGYLTEIDNADVAATNATAGGTTGLVDQLAINRGIIQSVETRLRAAPPPPLAAAAQQLFLESLPIAVEALDLMIVGLTTPDPKIVNQGTAKVSDFRVKLSAVRSEVARLNGICPG